MIEQQIGIVRCCSSFYYSAPWGYESENEFCNICCCVETERLPLEVLRITQQIEKDLGRNHKTIREDGHGTQYSDRPIDIDLILAYDNSGQEIRCCILADSMHSKSTIPLLTLPHPLWQQRDFVRIPLAEIQTKRYNKSANVTFARENS